ncbi:hypothetical protein [Dysgonomonas sp. HGC4]|uniref:hypothetical protein n=1 Tax=Dysgonomonas sp. HGC4 TaxID=1658009 RepID=UPI00067F94C8|nr:hypothetical protein [Dysgonomonas sp. HGC4]MBD8346507.1 hypothetical protein [Dysgonomonas sp. HGC4]
MINSIIEMFRRQAREHKTIRSFYYNRNYEIGSGNEAHPLFWLEDPLTGRNNANTFSNTANFSILFVPKDDSEIANLQNLAFSIGLNILERIKYDNAVPVSILPTWSYLTLRNYYDNNACGCRFTVDFVQRNMQDLCLIEEQFDVLKDFEAEGILNSFDVKTANTCETFINKLPVFDLKTSKR